MTTNYVGMDLAKKEETVILCGKRSGKDLKIYAIARTEVSPKKYLYGIICLGDIEEETNKVVTPIRYTNLTYIRRRFRNIPTSYNVKRNT